MNLVLMAERDNTAEDVAEYLAETTQFCIFNPEVPVGFPKSFPLVAHWWMREPRLHFLDEGGDIERTIVQCALCGVTTELPIVRIKRRK